MGEDRGEGEAAARTSGIIVKELAEMKNLTDLSQKLRKNSTDAEKKLWLQIRAKQIDGIKFRRQEQIGNYIADFYCSEKKLVIELDGGQHAESETDKNRDQFMERNGIRVIRIWNNDVLLNIEGVLEFIRESLNKRVDSYRYFRKKTGKQGVISSES